MAAWDDSPMRITGSIPVPAIMKKRKLITGDRVNEFAKDISLTQVVTHCPRKWVLLDLENGRFYGWRDSGTGYIALPPKAEKAVAKAVKNMDLRVID